MKGGQYGRVRSGRDEPPATEGSSKSLDPWQLGGDGGTVTKKLDGEACFI